MFFLSLLSVFRLLDVSVFMVSRIDTKGSCWYQDLIPLSAAPVFLKSDERKERGGNKKKNCRGAWMMAWLVCMDHCIRKPAFSDTIWNEVTECLLTVLLSSTS